MMFMDAFEMRDTHGLPLDVQWDAAKSAGGSVSLAAFACDALSAGWEKERINREILSVMPDADLTEFWRRMAELWGLAGHPKEIPDSWRLMKSHLKKGGHGRS